VNSGKTTSTCRLRSAQSRRATLVTHCCCERVRVASRHWGRASEAGAQRLYVKFAAVRPGAGADERFDALLNACLALAREVGMTTVVAGSIWHARTPTTRCVIADFAARCRSSRCIVRTSPATVGLTFTHSTSPRARSGLG